MLSNLDQLFGHWALQTPDREALLGLAQPALTFGQLEPQLQTLRAALRQRGFDRTARLALVAPNGPELALAFLAGATSAICAPLNPAYRREEMTFYLEDLEASALLIADTLDSPAREVAQARGIPILELHPLSGQPAGCLELGGSSGRPPVPEPPAHPDDLALILHTSGTTARPKQVPLTHANLCASIRHLQTTLALTPQDRCLNLMPLFHIHGLVGALLAALGSGGSVVCPPGFAAADFLEWLPRYQPTWYTAVPTIHQAILAQARRETAPPSRGALRFIRSSSASLPPTVMAEVEAVFGVPVIEAYGMTEAAHQMASNPLPPGVRKPGSVGRPAGPAICILSPEGAELPQGEVGEVAIQGPNVMAGYRQNPAANAQAFTAGWFRTGDQGYLDGEGYLFLTGRLKELINRGGEKIAPVEIDQALLAHPAVQQAVTFALPHPTLGEEVAAAVVLREAPPVTPAELQQFLVQSLADFKIPRQITVVSEIPKGPTGKIQRIGLAEKIIARRQDSSQEAGETFSSSALEQQIASLFSEILGRKDITVRDSFLQLGGDSISGAQLRSRIRDLFQVDLSWIQLFQEANSVVGLAKFIQDHPPGHDLSIWPPLQVSQNHTEFPLAFVQEPLWLATQLDPGNTTYNRSLVLALDGLLNREALERSLNEIVRRHKTLRTTFHLGPNGPKQIISPEAHEILRYYNLSNIPKSDVEEIFAASMTREMATPFDLVHGPVFRIILFQISESEHRLVLIIHHLVSDGWSDGVFFRELETFYNHFCSGEFSSFPELPIQYGDFVVWQKQWLSGKFLESQLDYWKDQLKGLHTFQVFPETKMPSGQIRQSGRREAVMLSPLQTDFVKTFSRQEGVTPFTILLAGFFILLHRWTEKNDLICGVPLANRIHPHLEPLIGFFVNTLPFRSTIQGEYTFRTFIQNLHSLSLGVFSHADVPFQELRQLLRGTLDLTGNFLYDILFVFENAPQYFPRLDNLTSNPIALPYGELALTNLSFFLWDHPSGIQGHMTFDEDVFENTMIRQLIRNYCGVLDRMRENPDAPLRSIQLEVGHSGSTIRNTQPPNVKLQSADHVPLAESGTIISNFTPEGIDSAALRREKIQKRFENLSQAKKEALHKKLKAFRPPTGQ